MTNLSISVLSTVYVKVPVTPKKNGAVIDPSSDVVVMAFKAANQDPGPSDWKPASWETIGSQVYARCLVGPFGDVTLAKGTYDQWVKVTDSPEIPVKKATNQLVIA